MPVAVVPASPPVARKPQATVSTNLFLTGTVTRFREFFSSSKNGVRSGWVSSAPDGFKITKRIV